MVTTRQPAAGPPTNLARSLSVRIVAGLIVGVAIGLFFGERAGILQIVAETYIKLLQMTVLPYVTISIIAGLGELNPAQARLLGKRVGLVLVALWTLALAYVFLFPLMFPTNENASFFSTALIEDRESFDFVNLYIPSNPFHALANNIVPAVVLFSIVLGIALIPVRDKDRFIAVLRVAGSAVSAATRFVVSLTPYGMVAIAAVAVGTMRLEDLARLQVYMITYTVVALLLSLWVLPGLVATLTPVPYRALMSRTRNALVMAFMTTSLFAVLPLLIEHAKALVKEYGSLSDEDAAAPDVIVPASFNFPHTGKLLSLSFLLFAGWFADTQVPVSSYPRMASTGLLAMFGSTNAAVPFLLDLFRIPGDTFQLFVASSPVNARLGTLVAAVHTVAIAVIGTCAVAGVLRTNGRKLARFAVVSLLVTAASIGGTRLLLQFALNRPYEKAEILSAMTMSRDRGEARVFRAGEQVPPLDDSTSLLQRIHDRRVLRVGYLDDSLPYAFFNVRGKLVGFDMEMAYQLAADLDVALELVPVSRATLDGTLDPRVCDMVMSGVAVSVDRATRLQFSSSYLDETIAFVVPDHMVGPFSEWASVREMSPLRLGVPRAPYYVRKIRDELGDVQMVTFDRFDDMFAPNAPPIDAFVLTAERGSAYTLLHPAYSVAVPKPRPFKVPLAYIIAGHDQSMTSVVNTWIEAKRKDGTIDALFAHWILGKDTVRRQPRWCIMHDVLGW